MVSIPLKDISQLGSLFPIYGKIKHVPNHQPVWYSWGFAMVYKPIVTELGFENAQKVAKSATERILGIIVLSGFLGVGKAFHMVYPLVMSK